MARTPDFDVVLVSDDAPDLAARAANVLAGMPCGRVALQLRRKDLSAAALHALASELRAITHAHGAQLLINERVDVALSVRADGVQLPENGLAPEVARQLLGRHACIGASRHDLDGVRAASAASFVLVSPVHAVAGKGTALGIAGIRGICAASSLPVYALGGIVAADVPALLAAGARGIAVIRAVWSASDPRAALSALLASFAAQGVAASDVQG